MQHAPLACNACGNLQVDGVQRFKVAACRRLVVTVDTVLEHVAVSVVRGVGAGTAAVAARSVRPPQLRRCCSLVGVPGILLAPKLAAVAAIEIASVQSRRHHRAWEGDNVQVRQVGLWMAETAPMWGQEEAAQDPK